ncbi:MAG: GNAT family N-acetyltransferase [Xanthomonadales bacterium]|nr:GNAT family N-acetyltransferase [Xanthomonadales bacterium]
MAIEIRIAKSRDDIARCYSIIAQLRPHLEEMDFVTTIERLSERTGFKLAYLLDRDARAVAGFRVSEWLHSGKHLEIEDLITNSTDRSKGYGRKLFDWLVAQARLEGCSQLCLVSGVKRIDAHRFYVRQGMVHEAQYFSLNL